MTYPIASLAGKGYSLPETGTIRKYYRTTVETDPENTGINVTSTVHQRFCFELVRDEPTDIC